MKKPAVGELLIGTITAVLVLLLGLIAGKGLDLLDLRVFALGIGFFVLLVATIVGVVYSSTAASIAMTYATRAS